MGDQNHILSVQLKEPIYVSTYNMIAHRNWGLYLTNDDDLSRLKLFSHRRLNIIAVYFSPGFSALIYCPHVYSAFSLKQIGVDLFIWLLYQGVLGSISSHFTLFFCFLCFCAGIFSLFLPGF